MNKKGIVTLKIARLLENDTKKCNMTVMAGATKDTATTLVKSFSVSKADVTLSAANINVKPAKLKAFYVNVEKSCSGYQSKTNDAGPKKVAIKTKRGSLKNINGVIKTLKKNIAQK